MICCSLNATSVDEALQQMTSLRLTADLCEVRLDYFDTIEREQLERLYAQKQFPLICTCRPKSEGGKYEGDEKKRIELLSECIDIGFEYVDIEHSSGKKIIAQFLKAKKETKIIVSHHDFEAFSDITALYTEMKTHKADIIKIATTPTAPHHNLSMLTLIEQAVKEKQEIIGVCMGELGMLSRILSPAYGAHLTYGSLNSGSETAPGQIKCEHLKRVYRVDKLKKEGLAVYGLVGNPVSQSKGYLIHNLLFKELDLNAVYVNFLVQDLKEFTTHFKSFVSGLSITMPYKQDIISFTDETKSIAADIGSVNTIISRKGKWIGFNTDYSGALKAIEEKTKLDSKNVVMLGAGGVACAIGYGIVRKKGKLTITNRDEDKGKALAKKLKSEYASKDAIDWNNTDLLINATPVGMYPKVNETPLNRNHLRNMIVFDTIYNPLVTRLISDAERNRCKTVSGLRMFIHQAADQFSLWTSKEADRDFMEEIILQYVVST